MHLQPYQPVRRRTACAYAAAMRTVPLFRTSVFGSILATAKAADVVARSADPGTAEPCCDKRFHIARSTASSHAAQWLLPVHRSILAVDIEGSTAAHQPGQRRATQRGLPACDRSSLRDRDRQPALLIRLSIAETDCWCCCAPADEFPKPAAAEPPDPSPGRAGSPRTTAGSPRPTTRAACGCERSSTQGRYTATGMGPFGEDLDVAFRLLDAPRFKKRSKRDGATRPGRIDLHLHRHPHGYGALDDPQILALVTVNVGDQRREGWVHLPRAGGISAVPPLPQAS